VWGGNYTWMKMAVPDMGIWLFNAVRYAGATAVTGALLAAASGARHVLPPPGERLGLALVGVLQIAGLSAFITIALQYIEASRTVLVVYTNPIWTLLLSIALLGERATWNRVVGLLLGLAGLVILTNPLAMAWTLDALLGVGAALGGTICWALGAVTYKRRIWTASFGQQLFMQLLACLAVSVPLAIWFDWGTPINPTHSLSLVLLWNMIGPTALGYLIWAHILTRVSASSATQVLLLSPIYGMLQSHLVLGEQLGSAILAAACVTLGAILTFWQPRRV
jgi:drug/metabolite transporter (DMT)-like permease